MKGRTVVDFEGREFELTEVEEKYIRALEKISKMKTGRIELFASGTIDVRINGRWQVNSIAGCCNVNIFCDGGDGGD